jgi:hypothetical protein
VFAVSNTAMSQSTKIILNIYFKSKVKSFSVENEISKIVKSSITYVRGHWKHCKSKSIEMQRLFSAQHWAIISSISTEAQIGAQMGSIADKRWRTKI